MTHPTDDLGTTTISVATGRPLIRRGEVVCLFGDQYRVTRASGDLLTIRPVLRWPWLEAALYWVERCILWPLGDLRRRVFHV
jgi:hypothetical protein